MLKSSKTKQISYAERKRSARLERAKREKDERMKTWKKGANSSKAIINAYVNKRLKQILVADRDHFDKVVEVCHMATGEGMHAFLDSVRPTMAEKKMSDLQKEYQTFFLDTLDKFGVTSPTEMTDDQKRDFFNEVNKGWIDGEGQGT